MGKGSGKKPTPEVVKQIQELRRSSAASPVNRKKPRSSEKREAIKKSQEDD